MTLKQYKYLPSIPCVPLNWYNFPFLELRQRVHRKGKLYRILHAAAALNDCSINIRNNVVISCLVSFVLSLYIIFFFSVFFVLYFASFAQLSFSSCFPIKATSHPTSLKEKLDLGEKRDTNAYNWSKRRSFRKIWQWNGFTCRDAASAPELSIIEQCAGSSNPPK